MARTKVPKVGDIVRLKNISTGNGNDFEAIVREVRDAWNWWVDIKTGNQRVRDYIAKYGSYADNWCYYEDHQWDVVGHVSIEVPKKTVAPVISTSPWNATCARCGKGVYNGFMKTEHEGGSCT